MPFVINGRMTSTLGRCDYKRNRNADWTWGDWYVCKLHINKKYFELASEKEVINTIMHELLHSNPKCVKTNCSHGGEWKRLATIVSKAYGDKYGDITRLHDLSSEVEYNKATKQRKHTYKCVCCGTKYKYKTQRGAFCKSFESNRNGRIAKLNRYSCCDCHGNEFMYLGCL